MANDPRLERLRLGQEHLLAQAQLCQELLDGGMRALDLCRVLGWRRPQLDECLAVLALPVPVRRSVASGRLDADRLHQLLRFNNIFLRFLERRQEGIESSGFLVFWVAYYQELYAKRYADRPLDEMKPAVDRVYEAAVRVMTRKFASLDELRLELETLKEGWAGRWARLKRWFRRRAARRSSADDADDTAAAASGPRSRKE